MTDICHTSLSQLSFCRLTTFTESGDNYTEIASDSDYVDSFSCKLTRSYRLVYWNILSVCAGSVCAGSVCLCRQADLPIKHRELPNIE